MGLRLVAHCFDRDEVLVAWSVLDAAEIAAFVHGFSYLTGEPSLTFAIGGYRLMVADQDLEVAVALLEAARREPLADAETLAIQHSPLLALGALFWFWLSGGIPFTPFRRRRWLPREG